MSLLNSQSAYIDNEPALTAIHNSQHRVHAMSLIHHKLYQLQDVRTIDMRQYLDEFITYLGNSYTGQKFIRFDSSIEPVILDIVYAVPVALIINEAVTNSIKHAFSGIDNGIISLAMARVDSEIRLTIADNGGGFNTAQCTRDCQTLGITMMRGLCSDINARIAFQNDHGTKISIAFHDVPLYEDASAQLA